jgi:hypothetical protein
MVDLFEFYEKMERNNIMLSFKGAITSELLSSILTIMESKMSDIQEPPKIKKKVFNVLVECLQNLYHHTDDAPEGTDGMDTKSAIFAISKEANHYSVFTGNYILTENVDGLRKKLETINGMNRDELKSYYKQVLNNGTMSDKGGGGLGMIDIARKSGQKLDYFFKVVDDSNSFFSLNVKIVQPNKEIA